MNSQGVEVLHVANRNAVVSSISDHFILDLLPAFHATLDQDLWACSKRLCAKFPQLFFIFCKSASKSSEGICRTNNNREADIFDHMHGLFKSRCRSRLGTFLADALHAPSEQLSILGSNDGVN